MLCLTASSLLLFVCGLLYRRAVAKQTMAVTTTSTSHRKQTAQQRSTSIISISSSSKQGLLLRLSAPRALPAVLLCEQVTFEAVVSSAPLLTLYRFDWSTTQVSEMHTLRVHMQRCGCVAASCSLFTHTQRYCYKCCSQLLWSCKPVSVTLSAEHAACLFTVCWITGIIMRAGCLY